MTSTTGSETNLHTLEQTQSPGRYLTVQLKYLLLKLSFLECHPTQFVTSQIFQASADQQGLRVGC